MIRYISLFSILLMAAGNAGAQVTDHQGKNYKTVKIGNQTWMSENLDAGTFRNGEPITEATSAEEWKKMGIEGKPAWCYYGFNAESGAQYGKLYNWYAVNDARGLAPKGWHVPTDEEWTQLTEFLGGHQTAGIKTKNITGWKDNGNGNNSSGFAGLPGGYCNAFGAFFNESNSGYWWSSTENGKSYAWYRVLTYSYKDMYRDDYYEQHGLSVRCLRD